MFHIIPKIFTKTEIETNGRCEGKLGLYVQKGYELSRRLIKSRRHMTSTEHFIFISKNYVRNQLNCLTLNCVFYTIIIKPVIISNIRTLLLRDLYVYENLLYQNFVVP